MQRPDRSEVAAVRSHEHHANPCHVHAANAGFLRAEGLAERAAGQVGQDDALALLAVATAISLIASLTNFLPSTATTARLPALSEPLGTAARRCAATRFRSASWLPCGNAYHLMPR